MKTYEMPGKTSDTLIIVPPFIDMGMPALAPQLLQAMAKEEHMPVQILYANFSFAYETGLGVYDYLANDYLYFSGERIFFTGAFDGCQDGIDLNKISDEYGIPDHMLNIKNERIRRLWHKTIYTNQHEQTDLNEISNKALGWSVRIAKSIVENEYKVVGFSTTLGSVNACLCIANQVKKLNPEIITVIGGSSCDGIMAKGMLSIGHAIDFIFQGESDITFPRFLKNAHNGLFPDDKLIKEQKVMNMNILKVPYYGEYFDQLNYFNSKSTDQVKNIGVKYEASRGCWWNACKFCGLNGEKKHRFKDPDLVMKDIDVLLKRNDARAIALADTIFPRSYYSDLLPKLSGKYEKLKLFLEIKGNVSLEQIIKLRQAGVVQVQPGIESLSDDLLKLMNKGITVKEIIQLLRYSRATDLYVVWNLLFGFPNDKINSYEEMNSLIPLLYHLPPPTNRISSLRISRFSPYFDQPEKYGIHNLKPAEIYKSYLPKETDFNNYSFFYTGEFESESLDNLNIMRQLSDKIRRWNSLWNSPGFQLPSLYIEKISDNIFTLSDSRNIDNPKDETKVTYELAKMLLTVSRYKDTKAYEWALQNNLGIVRDEWFIPLATAEPALILEMEKGSENDSQVVLSEQYDDNGQGR